MIPEIDKQQITVIAFAVDPTRQANRLAGIIAAQLATIMGAERMEVRVCHSIKFFKKSVGKKGTAQSNLYAAPVLTESADFTRDLAN